MFGQASDAAGQNKRHMNACITLREIANLTSEEAERVARTAKMYDPALDGGTFFNQVRSLESSVIHAYKIAVYLAKRTTDLRELCDIWKTASDICDSVLVTMKRLKDSRPESGTPPLYDLALDYKNAAFKRYQLNLESLQWEQKEPPAELFPKTN